MYNQIVANPNVEIYAMLGNEFLRYYGTAVFYTDKALSEKALNLMPEIKKRMKPTDIKWLCSILIMPQPSSEQ